MKKTILATMRTQTKKKVLVGTFALALLLTTSVTGYSQAYKKGDNLLNLGIGVGNTYSGTVISGSFEHGISDVISIGVGADLLHYSYSTYPYNYSYNFYYFAVRGSYHLAEVLNVEGNKFDPYAGAGLGFVSYGNYISSAVFLQAHVGARYYFAPKIAGFAEVGAGAATLKIGVAFKF